MIPASGFRAEPDTDCQLCPRLAAFRQDVRSREPLWHNAPVDSFGDPKASLLIVGLAPGMGGANRTGRPFTGDYAGIVLYPALARYGFSRGNFDARPDDGLKLIDCRITNAVRCLPPQNKPKGAEISACRPFLADELTAQPAPRCILALGRIAFDSTLRCLDLKPSKFAFAHNSEFDLENGQCLVASYHCSRYNVNTGRLTEAMFDAVMTRVRGIVGQALPE